MATELRDKVAVITGASSGIGAALARELAGAGMRVALIARRAERLAALAEELGERAMALTADLRQLEAVPGLLDQVVERWGPLWAVINNAGIGRNAPLLSGNDDDWREMLELNVLALAVVSREGIARMADERGHVFHVSSMSGHRPSSGSGLYAATKHAVRAITAVMRAELKARGSQIRVGSISPGFVETEFAANFHRDHPERAAESYARYPVISAPELAALIRAQLELPEHIEVHDVLVRPTAQPN